MLFFVFVISLGYKIVLWLFIMSRVMLEAAPTVKSEVTKQGGDQVEEEAQGDAHVSYVLHPLLGGPAIGGDSDGSDLVGPAGPHPARTGETHTPAQLRVDGQDCGVAEEGERQGWHCISALEGRAKRCSLASECPHGPRLPERPMDTHLTGDDEQLGYTVGGGGIRELEDTSRARIVKGSFYSQLAVQCC